jgi:hypothetical protein
MRRSFVVLAVSVLGLLAACSSERDVGEGCDVPAGTRDVCEPGAICGRFSEKTRAFACVPICDRDDHCPRDSDCKEVEKSGIKGCRWKN